MSIRHKNDTKDLVASTVVMFIAIILSRFFQDFIYIFVILSFCVLIFLFSYRFKFKFFFKSLAVFLFLHLIIFPLIYVLILKVDSSSFEFDSTIFDNEKKYSISNIQNKYDSEKLNEDLKFIDSVITEKSNKLNLNLKYLNEGNIIITSKFMLSKNCSNDSSRKFPLATFNISDLKGSLICSISTYKEGCTIEDSERTILEFLTEKKRKLSEKSSNYTQEYIEITENNRIWSYRQILPYSLNIFFTGNINPKSKLANVVFFIHQILVFAFLLSLIVSQFPLIKNSNNNSNE